MPGESSEKDENSPSADKDVEVIDAGADDSSSSTLRRRKGAGKTGGDDASGEAAPQEEDGDAKKKDAGGDEGSWCLESGSYWLTRIVLLRYTAFIYCIAFFVALQQNSALLGKNGLLPADKYLDDVRRHTKNETWSLYQHAPTLLWLFDYKDNVDYLLECIAYAGLGLSIFVLLLGAANIPIMLALWLLYHSIVNVGQRWYSFGWESQLLETGFLAAFLCPLLSLRRLPKYCATSFIVLWGFRWLIFRIMLGAGLIKIRGDKCWRDLTCMNYHYQTQPVPNPVSYYMHQEPELIHKFETLSNHFIELIAPFFLLLGRRMRIVGGCIQILFQMVLIISGNLSFLNWLTILPSLACFDDRSISWMFPSHRGSTKWRVKEIQKDGGVHKLACKPWGYCVRRMFNIALGLLVAYLSVPIVQNLWSSTQVMNTSFDPLRIVNTYGAFGSVTKERTEVIFQGTHDDPNNPEAKWAEYEFKCKPGSVKRRPCLISPYHYRLDWLMWFAAFQSYQHNPWLIHLATKFLVNDPGATSLIAHNPFMDKDPPKWVRAEHYRYTFTKIKTSSKNWWKRKRIGNYLPPVSLDSVADIVKSMGWPTPRLPLPKGRKSKKKK